MAKVEAIIWVASGRVRVVLVGTRNWSFSMDLAAEKPRAWQLAVSVFGPSAAPLGTPIATEIRIHASVKGVVRCKLVAFSRRA
jgi:hypothetical protein